jgi:TatD DNase family protein
MKFIDTHSHIYLSQFDEDLDLTVERAIENSVNKIILPNIDSESILANKEISKKYPEVCYSLMGLHPTYVKDNFKDELENIFSELESGSYIGIGEIGIDLYWDKTHIEEQKIAFKEQVGYALKNNLPFVVHARESFNEIIKVLEEINSPTYKGIFHAFSGTIENAQKIIEMGFLLGIGGVVTFKNSKLPEVVEHIDLSHVVLETDSPYLAPTPHRGKRNESSYIPLIAKKIAEIKSTSLEKVAELTSSNATILFGL